MTDETEPTEPAKEPVPEPPEPTDPEDEVVEKTASLGPVKTLDLPEQHVLSVDTEKRILGLRVIR